MLLIYLEIGKTTNLKLVGEKYLVYEIKISELKFEYAIEWALIVSTLRFGARGLRGIR